jgi:hypothetical protein
MLEPNVVGHGTHTQLGLEPCTVLSLTSVPCPMCGMTTSFAWMIRGHWCAAMIVQPMGALLFLSMACLGGLGAVEWVRPTGRWRVVWSFLRAFEGRVVAGFFLLLAMAWVYKMWRLGVFS